MYVRDRLEAPETRHTPPGPLGRKPPHRAHYFLRQLLAKAAIAASSKHERNMPDGRNIEAVSPKIFGHFFAADEGEEGR